MERKLYVSGIRDSNGCLEKGCNKLTEKSINSLLVLECEENNPKDDNAIKIMYNNTKMGYVLRYYSKKVNEYKKIKKL